MRTYQQIKRALANAERAVDKWYDRLDEALQNYAIICDTTKISFDVAFYNAFHYESDDAPLQVSNVAAALSKSGEDVYEWDSEECCWAEKSLSDAATRRVIKQIARLEKKLNDWNATRYWLECVLDNIDEAGTPYSSASWEECARELDALGHSIS